MPHLRSISDWRIQTWSGYIQASYMEVFNIYNIYIVYKINKITYTKDTNKSFSGHLVMRGL